MGYTWLYPAKGGFSEFEKDILYRVIYLTLSPPPPPGQKPQATGLKSLLII